MAQKITPYEWASNVPENVLRFDTNTLPDPPPIVKEFGEKLIKNCPINEYGDPSYAKLRNLIASYENVKPDKITITNSGDEALDIVSKAFLNPGDFFIIQPPTFERFRLQSEINRGQCIEVPLTPQFNIDLISLLKTIQQIKPKITFVCNPNNPTGTVTSNETIETILKKSSGIVLVDEVYREFYGKSSVALLNKYPNLVILRSFSKFGAMAGARIGYLMASPKLSQVFDAIRLPMGVSWFSYKFAETLLEKNTGWIESQSQKIKSERSRLTQELIDLGLKVVPSQANFLLVNFGTSAKTVCDKLKKQNILVRDRSSKPYLNGYVRITVRNREQNDVLITSLSKLLCEIWKQIGDWHTQTIAHGSYPETPLLVEQTVKAAMQFGLERICLTDHYPLPPDFIDPTKDQDCSMPREWYFRRYLDEVGIVQEQFAQDCEVLYGAEFDWLRDYQNWTQLQTNTRQYDYLIGSVHFVPDDSGKYWIIDYTKEVFEQGVKAFGGIQPLVQAYYREVRAMIRSGLFDGAGHIDLIKKYSQLDDPLFDRQSAWYRGEVTQTLDVLAASTMSMEINTAGWEKQCAEQYPAQWILKEGRSRNIPLTIGSDGHKPEEIGRKLDRAVKLARQVGYESLAVYKARKQLLVSI